MNTDTTTDLATVAELYVPIMDDTGKYTDSIPKINGGLRCSCGSATVFMTRAAFRHHSTALCHKKWRDSLNSNRLNYYTESIKQKEIIDSQKIIIQQQSKKIQIKNYVIRDKDATIKYLLSQLTKDVDSGKISLIDL